MPDLISIPLSAAREAAATLNNRGLDLMKSRAMKKALVCFDSALAIEPELAPVHFNRGNVLSAMERFAEALVSYDRAMLLGLDMVGLHYRRGLALYELDRLQEALASFDRALAMQPDMPGAVYGRGFVLQNLGRLDEAKVSYERALVLQPTPQVKLSLGMTYLAEGRWREGWEYYESRWNGSHETGKGRVRRLITSLPQWNGEAATEQDNLLVFVEQGLGDMLQFCRYLPLAAARFVKVTLVCPQPLVRLFRASFSPAIEILEAHPQDQSGWHWQCPMMSLPRAFGATPENLPRDIPYLRLRPGWVDKWRSRLRGLAASRLKVGLVWAGFKNHKSDARRSISLSRFDPLLKERGVAWISLQKGGKTNPQAGAAAAAGLIDWMDEVEDFADTAGLVAALDLVISIDTSVVHLAGALGKPVWMLNRFESEWRWMRDREDSPWYPTLRIFNQKNAGGWDEVLTRVLSALPARPE